MRHKLTATAVKQVKPLGKAQKLTDGAGLYLYVHPQGGGNTGGLIIALLINVRPLRWVFIQMSVWPMQEHLIRVPENSSPQVSTLQKVSVFKS